MGLFSKRYDIFISYVVEDREIVEQLYDALSAKGLRVWYAKNELYPGADIRRVILDGLAQSQYGIAIVSPLYTTHWAFGELFYMMKDEETLIPVIHKTTVEVLARRHPELITRYCLHTQNGVESVAKEIVKLVKERSKFRPFFRLSAYSPRKSMLGTSLIALFMLSMFLIFYQSSNKQPNETFINQQIEDRITNLESMIQRERQKDLELNDASPSSLQAVIQEEAKHFKKDHSYRNYFDFYDGQAHIRTQRGLKDAGIVPKDNPILAPFGIFEYRTYLFKADQNIPAGLGYSLVSTLPMSYQIKATRSGEDFCEVDVTYGNFLRYVVVYVSVDSLQNRRTSEHYLYGIKPNETYVFEKEAENWSLSLIR